MLDFSHLTVFDFCPVPLCHMEGGADDGGGKYVLSGPRRRVSPHAAGVRHDDQHLRGLWAWDSGAGQPEQNLH